MLESNIVTRDLFSKAELSNIMRIDAKLVSSDIKLYCLANEEAYCVLLNTWLYMCAQYCSGRAADALIDCINRKGLLSVIDSCSNLASDVIRSDFTLDNLGDYGFLCHEDPRITLQMLRYPKRFSPDCADKVKRQGIQDLLYINRRNAGEPTVIDRTTGKVLERRKHFPRFLIEGVRFYCSRLLHLRIKESDPLKYGSFSNGATADNCHTMFEKYRAFARLTPGYHDSYLYALPRYGNEDQGEVDDIDYVRAVAVPKSYKAPRIIAEVSAKTQYHMQGIRRRAEESIRTSRYCDLIILNDQTINQEWSWVGSIDGSLCTIDSTAASDSIADDFAACVLPDDWYAVISAWNPPYIMIDGKKYKRNIFLTSGSGDTFVMESIIFLAIALFATEQVELLTGAKLHKPRVYGDDLICDSRAFDTVIDFLGMAGVVANKEKSFNEGHYRESCGAEWWCGLDTSTRYFPRKTMICGAETDIPAFIQSLIELQHRLFEFEYSERWLTRYIKKLYKRFHVKKELTSSLPGTECDDLWSVYPYYKVMYPPYDHSKSDGTDIPCRREAHSTLVLPKMTEDRLKMLFEQYYHRPLIPMDIRLCEMFRYVDFLRHGTPVDEYGIPIHRQDVSADLVIDKAVWTTRSR